LEVAVKMLHQGGAGLSQNSIAEFKREAGMHCIAVEC
jgi:hypothetical protein